MIIDDEGITDEDGWYTAILPNTGKIAERSVSGINVYGK